MRINMRFLSVVARARLTVSFCFNVGTCMGFIEGIYSTEINCFYNYEKNKELHLSAKIL